MRVTNLSQDQWPYRPPATAASWQSPFSRLSCRSGSFLFGRMAASYTTWKELLSKVIEAGSSPFMLRVTMNNSVF